MEYLLVTVLGTDEPGMVNKIFKLIFSCDCQLINVHINTMGLGLTAVLLLSGQWNALAKFETRFPAFQKKHNLQGLIARTGFKLPQPERLPYSAYIVAPDQRDVVYKITQFLTERKVGVHELAVASYKAPATEAPMLGITIMFSLSAANTLADFREQFIVFCDDHNFDLALESQRN